MDVDETIKMDKEEVIKANFVPLPSLRRAVELLETPLRDKEKRCKRNLALLQRNKSVYEAEVQQHNWRNIYHMALRRAIYAHRWNQVAYLLSKSPIWEQEKSGELHTYVRALTILLMNHPSAKAQSLLNDYAHMVLACRTIQDKNAVYKSILCLTQKLYGRTHRG